MNKNKKIFWGIGIVLLSPVILFLVITLLLYLPPVQNWAVGKVAAYASETTGMEISVGRVNLEFPLDLGIDNFRVIKQNDSLPQVKDTIADMKRMVVDVELMPLFSSKVVIKTLEINNTKVNTSNLIASARVKGSVGLLKVASDGIDLNKQTVSLNGARLDNANIDIALSDTVPEDTTASETLWKIYADRLNINNSRLTLHMPGDTMQVATLLAKAEAKTAAIDLGKGKYTVTSVDINQSTLDYDNNFEPRLKGLDYNHISLSGINIGIDSIYYCDADLRLKLRRCDMREKSGLTLTRLDGQVAMDSTKLRLPLLRLNTPDSQVEANVDLDLNIADEKNPGKAYVRLLASIGKQDIMRFAGDMPEAFVRQYPNHPITIKGSVNGNMNRVEFTGVDINLPTAFHLATNGFAANPTDMKALRAEVALRAQTQNLAFLTALAPKGTMSDYRLPAMTVKGDLKVNRERYDADLTLREGKGSVRAKGYFDMRRTAYAANLNINKLNVHHFMPKDSIYTITAGIDARGAGFDIFSRSTWLKAVAEVKELGYGSWNLNDMRATANVYSGKGDINVDVHNALADGTINIGALMLKHRVDATIAADLAKADLHALRVSERQMTASVCAHIDVASDLKQTHKVQGLINDFTIRTGKRNYRPTDTSIDIFTSPDTTWAKLSSGTLFVDLIASGGYEKLIKRGQAMADEVMKQVDNRIIDNAKIKKLLPDMCLRFKSEKDNPMANFLRVKGVGFESVDIDIDSSPEEGLRGGGHIYSLNVDSTQIDTIALRLWQESDSLRYKLRVENNKRNPQFVFKSLLEGALAEKSAGVNVSVWDAKNVLGVKLGALAEMGDSGINVHLTPYDPIIGYKKFSLNTDNYLLLGRNNRLAADVDMLADDGTGVKVYSTDDDPTALQDITVSLNQFDLAKVTAILPYVPRVEGTLNGDFHAVLDADNHLSVASDMSVRNMVYERCPMGNISSEFVYMMREGDEHYVEARLSKDDREIGLLVGSYFNEGNGSIDATFTMNHLPLDLVNGFVPDQLAGLEGFGEGKLAIKGPMDRFIVDGEVYLDSAALVSVPYGMRLRLDDDPVRIVGSNLLFENFNIYGHNDNPLTIYGNVDFSNLDKIMIEMRMRATNYQIINAKKNRRSVAYGKAFVNFMGGAWGALDNLRMGGQLDVLGTTNMTYILRDSPLSTDDQLKDLITFTDFRDTTSVVNTVRPTIGGLNMSLMMNIESGARIICALNADESNYVNLEGGGDLRMKYNPTESLQLFGRYTLNDGEMKYALPVIPLKTFTIQPDSYVEFSGDVMNPTLNITALEETRSTVSSSDGGSRVVTFKTGVKVTNTLSNMGLEFLIEAPSDMTITNELSSMGEDERRKVAVTMLTTGMYFADGNTNDFSMNSALNSFLQSQINSITQKAIPLDLSLGIDQSSDASGNTTTDYSFKFAKRFWNNRFNFVIGGKLSNTKGATARKSDEVYIDNISLEYRLDNTASRYVKMFYQKDMGDVLEEDVSKYGAGIILKRKMNSPFEIFDFRKIKSMFISRGDTLRRDTIGKPNNAK